MKEQASNNLAQRNFNRFSEQINEIKKPISGAIGGILSYNKKDNSENIITASFFNKANKIVEQGDIDNAHIFIQSYKEQYKRLKEELNLEESINDSQKKILDNLINAITLKLTMFEYAIYIEAEKGGYALDINKKKEYLLKIEEIETIIYGSKISDLDKEVGIIGSYLKGLVLKNEDNISSEEKSAMNSFVDTITIKDTKQYSKENIEDTSKKISRETFCEIFQKVFSIYNIESKIIIIEKNRTETEEKDGILYISAESESDERKKIYKEYGYTGQKIIITPERSSVSIGKNIINIPDIYKTLSIKKICELIEHEINTHALTSKNNNKTLNIKSDSYLELQEGVAVLNERLVSQNINDIEGKIPSDNYIFTLIGEKCTAEQSQKIIKTYFKLIGKTEEDAEKLSITRTERIKRFHANNLPGANRKDVCYRRGLTEVVKYIQGLDRNKQEDILKLQQDINTFYISELGKSDIENADKLLEGFNVPQESIIMPIAIGKIIYEKFLGNNVNNIDDIRFKASDRKMNYKQKKILLQIIEMMK